MVFRVPFGLADDAALRVDPHLGELADLAVEGAMRQLQLEVNAVALDDLVPAHHAAGAVGHIVVTQAFVQRDEGRSEEHTSELQSLMRISYAVFCLKKKKHTNHDNPTQHNNIK